MPRLSRAWIFVSHSTKDLEGVRRLRNELEARGAEPLLFFLKAIEEREELRRLLRREIEARSFFLLCDSAAARESPWVREEHEYVQSLAGKRVATIAIEGDWREQVAVVEDMLKAATVFLSYAHRDRDHVLPYGQLLRRYDFAVWDDTKISVGASFAANIEEGLRKAADNGYLIAFLSAASLGSQYAQREIATYEELTQSTSRMILIDLEPVDTLVPATMRQVQRLKFYAQDSATNERMLLKAVGLG